MRKSLCPLLLISVVFLPALFASVGDGRAGDMMAKPGTDKVVLKSYTVSLKGYQQTVTVNATEKKLFDFLSRPNNLTYPNMNFKEARPALGHDEFGPGGSIPYVYKMVVAFPTRMIVLKLDQQKVWQIQYDNPDYKLWRWELEPVSDGVRATFKTTYEVPDWAELAYLALNPKYWDKSSDRMLAELQARFDPSEDPDKLVAKGIRGEGYQSVIQVYEASVWIDARPKEVERAIADPNALSPLLGQDRGGCLSRTLPQDRVLYCLATMDHEGQAITIENFGIDHSHGLKLRYRFYQIALDLVGKLEIVCRPQRRGTRLVLTWKWEMPDSLAPGSVERAIFIARLPERIQEAASRIKQKAESDP